MFVFVFNYINLPSGLFFQNRFLDGLDILLSEGELDRGVEALEGVLPSVAGAGHLKEERLAAELEGAFHAGSDLFRSFPHDAVHLARSGLGMHAQQKGRFRVLDGPDDHPELVVARIDGHGSTFDDQLVRSSAGLLAKHIKACSKQYCNRQYQVFHYGFSIIEVVLFYLSPLSPTRSGATASPACHRPVHSLE